MDPLPLPEMMASNNYKDKRRRRLVQIDVCPQELRFTQDSIKNKFQPPYDNMRIDEAVELIRKKLLSPSQFKPLNVVNHNGILWSLDNRRLWVFRKAGVELVTVNLVSTDFSARSIQFFRELNLDLERQYSSATYFPRVRRPPISATEIVSVENVEVKFEAACARAVSERDKVYVPSYLPPSSNASPPKTIEVGPRVCRSSLAQIEVRPQELRFTRDSIKNKFEPPYENMRIDEAVELIRKNLLSPSQFKLLNVVRHNGISWSLDNRRLWVFRKSGVELVRANLVLTNFSERSFQFFSELNPHLARQYSSATYFPRVLGPIRATETVSVEIVEVKFEPGSVREVSEQAKVHVPTYLPPSSHASPPKTIEVAPRACRSSNVSVPDKRFCDRKNPSLAKKAMDASWFILKKSFGFLRQAFNGERSGGKKVVRLGINALIAFSFCFMARKAFNLGKKGAINVSSQTVREGERPSGSENGVSSRAEEIMAKRLEAAKISMCVF